MSNRLECQRCGHTAFLFAGIYFYGTHLVATVDIMGVIVKKDVRDKLIIYAGTYLGLLLLVTVSSKHVPSGLLVSCVLGNYI